MTSLERPPAASRRSRDGERSSGLLAIAGAGLAVLALAGVLTVGLTATAALGWWLTVSSSDATPDHTHGAVGAAHVSTDPTGDGYRVWDRNEDGAPVRWDPCSTIELVVAPEGAPDGFDDDLEQALARLRSATGLDLRVVGTTDERPSRSRSPYQPDRYGRRWAPVLVTWASPAETASLRDTDRGVAIPVAVGRAGERAYVSGQVVLNRDRDDLRPGYGDRSDSWGATILHELAHLLGLGHSDDPDELMATHPGEGPVAFGPGDRRGLRAVGDDGRCRPVPRPQHVEVALAR